jgi:hypothetical protein
VLEGVVYFEIARIVPCVPVILMPSDRHQAAFLRSHTDIKGFLTVSNKRSPSLMMTCDVLGYDAV